MQLSNIVPTVTVKYVDVKKKNPRENSPILNFLLMWVLPGILFYMLWRNMSRMVQGRMAGGDDNVLSFGKSGAKI